MTSRRLLENAIWISVTSSPSFFIEDHGSFPPMTFRRLEDNNSQSNPDQNNGIYDFNARFNPSMAIIIVVLLAAFFFMGFFSIYLRRCTTEEEGSRYGGRPGRNHHQNEGGWNREATRGLDRSVIESFPVFSYNLVKGLKTQTKGSECAVCLNDFEDDEMLRLLPKCSHAFHPECIDMWLCSHTTCPVCRTELLPHDDANPTNTDFGVVEPEPGPSEQVAIVVDNGESAPVSRHGSVRAVAPEPSHDSPILGLFANETTDEFRRSHSTGNSLVRLRKDLEKCTEWYIATPAGLTPGLHRSCSFVAMHHSRSQRPLSGFKLPKPGVDDGCSSQGDCSTRSERWGGISSMNPSAFFRSFSERPVARQYDQRALGVEGPSQAQERTAYLKKTLQWLTGRDREGSQGGSRSSRRGDPSGATTSAA